MFNICSNHYNIILNSKLKPNTGVPHNLKYTSSYNFFDTPM